MKRIATIFILILGGLISYGQTELTDDEAEAKLIVQNDRLIIIDFYATWCGPCKMMEPILEELVEKYEDRVDFYKVDVDKNEIDDAFKITAMPTFLFIKNGSSLGEIQGALTKEVFEELITAGIAEGSDEISEESESTSTTSSSSEIDLDDFSQENILNLWDSYKDLNSLAWNAYKNYEDITTLLKAIKIVERSIELNKNYYNVETHASLLFKTGSYSKALKKAKEAIDIAKEEQIDYKPTTELIEKIIDEM